MAFWVKVDISIVPLRFHSIVRNGVKTVITNEMYDAGPKLPNGVNWSQDGLDLNGNRTIGPWLWVDRGGSRLPDGLRAGYHFGFEYGLFVTNPYTLGSQGQKTEVINALGKTTTYSGTRAC